MISEKLISFLPFSSNNTEFEKDYLLLNLLLFQKRKCLIKLFSSKNCKVKAYYVKEGKILYIDSMNQNLIYVIAL